MEDIRNRAKLLLHDAFNGSDRVVAKIETKCYNLYKHNPVLYNIKIVSIIQKTGDETKGIDPEELMDMSPYDIYPHLYEERAKILSSIDVSNNVSMSIYKCPQCHAKDHSIEEIQLRSLDEGATVYATCNKCGHRWKP
jgi:DNA-directed RNA polymerase subunit M/transcription elongation factor TFIIS